VKASHLLALYRLAEMGAARGFVPLSTGVIAKGLAVSQQTASRRLIEMQKRGLIERSANGRVLRVKITREGLSGLVEMYRVLKPMFESPEQELVFNAMVFTGLSEGSYYMSLEGYRKQFRSKLGFDPFPGTLNLRLAKESMTERRELEKYPFVGIDGFADKDRTYGGARCYPVIVEHKVHAAIVMPIRAHYGDDVIEIIAADNLRRKLHLKDGDAVNIRVPHNATS
jgi:riboflavin kinase, archaea type